MKHLTYLKWLNVASAVLLGLTGLLTVGSMVATGAALYAIDERAMVALVPVAVITGLTTLLLAVAFGLCVIAAMGVEHGKARASQTVLALISLTSLPLGTAYGIYAIWLCWFNAETKATFQTSAARDGALVGLGLLLMAAPMVPVIGLSVPPLFPTNVERLDAEWEPLADRSQRIDRPGCGLTEVGPDCKPAKPTSVETELVSFPTRSEAMGWSELKGTLHVPKGLEGPVPGVILVHGSGPTDRDAEAPGEVVASYGTSIKLFEVLANHLANQGLVVLRYDKRACPKCYPVEHHKANYDEFRFGLFLEDALAAGDYLASRPEVDPDALIVIGHSQGGGFTPHIAAADDRYVAAVMLAGFTGTFVDALLDQLERVGDIRKAQWDYLSAWALDVQIAMIDGCVGQLDGEYDPTSQCLGGGVPLQAIAEYDELNKTTRSVISQLDTPLLAINGTVDRNVPPEELMAIRDAAKGRDAEFHLIAGVGHGLRDLVDDSQADEVDPEVLAVIDGFLASVKRPTVASD